MLKKHSGFISRECLVTERIEVHTVRQIREDEEGNSSLFLIYWSSSFRLETWAFWYNHSQSEIWATLWATLALIMSKSFCSYQLLELMTKIFCLSLRQVGTKLIWGTRESSSPWDSLLYHTNYHSTELIWLHRPQLTAYWWTNVLQNHFSVNTCVHLSHDPILSSLIHQGCG